MIVLGQDVCKELAFFLDLHELKQMIKQSISMKIRRF